MSKLERLRVGVLCILLCSLHAMGSPAIDIRHGPVVSRVPAWNASGLGPLPWQGIACIDLAPDGKLIAVGTIAPLGDPNVFLLDGDGKILQQHAVGQRFNGEIAAFADGPGVAAISTSPTGAADDPPALFRFAAGQQTGHSINDFQPLLFQYGEHSNHYARALGVDRESLILATPDGVRWLNASASPHAEFVARDGRHDGRISALAVSAGGRIVVGSIVNESDSGAELKNLAVLEKQKPGPLWARSAEDAKDVDAAAPLAAGLYGPHAKMQDKLVWGPLSVAIDGDGKRTASADYQGYERFVLPHTPDEALRPLRSIGVRFTAARPAVHVYDASGNKIRTFAPAAFEKAIWVDLAFSANGETLLAYPHHWASRGLAGQPNLPADDDARTIYALSIGDGDVRAIHFPDAVSDVAVAGENTVVACWDGRVYILGSDLRPIAKLLDGIDVGAPSIIKASGDGGKILIATAQGILHLLDGDGLELWKNDLAQTAKPGDKPWTRADRKGSQIGPGVWRNNTGRAQSDLGNQIVIAAPDGLIMVDPNSGHSFEQNWATIKAEGLDPMRVKYILPTHEHGDHAPGSYLWRVITGAKVIASPEMAYTLQHDLPFTSGYGFHPPVPVDILVDRDTDMTLCGLKVRVLRLPGHTYGSMGALFEMGGRKYVTLGDLIMPDGPLGYSGSVNFRAEDVLASLKKLDGLKPDYVLCGHGDGTPDHFIAAGIAAGEATGWGKMTPPKPDPTFGFAYKNYQVVGWLDTIYAAAFGDIDGDGLDDIATVTPGENGLLVKIYLNKKGHFEDKPDQTVKVPGMGPAFKLRINHLTKGKVADLMVSSESSAVMLLAKAGGKLDWTIVPIPGAVRAASFAADRNCDLPECVIGQRFVQGCLLGHLQADGSLKFTDGPKLAHSALELQLRDVNGDGKSDLITSAGEIFLRGGDGKLPALASLTLDRPFGEWTYLAVGDFTGTAKPDIVQIGMVGVHAMAAVFHNTGDAAVPFHKSPAAQIDLGIQFDQIRDGPTVADYTGDGIDDLILGHSQREDVLIIPGSKMAGLDRKKDIRVKLDYRLHYDTKIGLINLDGKGRKAIASFGTSLVGAGGIYIRMPDGG
ncbi:MAG TPA: MBL fold metallo-hydrolase [Tepidisphaeraceae bacterium]|nr:MBL fold metallo-hydrolase [Tepidisphaeraceae bacterium]